MKITILLTFIVVCMLLSCNSSVNKPASALSKDSAVVTPEPAKTPVYTLLRVTDLKTYSDMDDSDTGTIDNTGRPESIKIDLDSFAGQVAIYRGAELTLLGPVNWKGREDDGNGHREMRLYPGNDPLGDKFYMKLYKMYGASLFIRDMAAPLFPEAKKAEDNDDGMEHTPDTSTEWKDVVIVRFSKTLVKYHFPPKNGLQKLGVVLYRCNENDPDSQYYLSLEIVLPDSYRALSDYLSKQFIELNKLE